MASETPKKPRKPRRNFEREQAALRLYIETKLELLKESSGANGMNDLAVGQETALYGVLKRMEPKA